MRGMMSIMTASGQELRLVHALPGRARIHVPWWAEQTERTAAPRLARLPGVRQVRGNPLTGNVLVLFDDAVTDLPAILGWLRTLRPPYPVQPAVAMLLSPLSATTYADASWPRSIARTLGEASGLLDKLSTVIGLAACVVNLLFSGNVLGLLVNGLELLRICVDAPARRDTAGPMVLLSLLPQPASGYAPAVQRADCSRGCVLLLSPGAVAPLPILL